MWNCVFLKRDKLCIFTLISIILLGKYDIISGLNMEKDCDNHKELAKIFIFLSSSKPKINVYVSVTSLSQLYKLMHPYSG